MQLYLNFVQMFLFILNMYLESNCVYTYVQNYTKS